PAGTLRTGDGDAALGDRPGHVVAERGLHTPREGSSRDGGGGRRGGRRRRRGRGRRIGGGCWCGCGLVFNGNDGVLRRIPDSLPVRLRDVDTETTGRGCRRGDFYGEGAAAPCDHSGGNKLGGPLGNASLVEAGSTLGADSDVHAG